MTGEWGGLLARFMSEVDQTHRELQFQNWLHSQLDPYFHLKREVEGHSLRTGKRVRIDFLAKARHTLTGFPKHVFGVEAKYPQGWGDAKSHFSRGCEWFGQMIQYRHSRFWSDKEKAEVILPAFILSAPPLSDVDPLLQPTGLLGLRVGLGELNFWPRKTWEEYDCLGNTFDTTLEIRFVTAFWRNTYGNSERKLGRKLLET